MDSGAEDEAADRALNSVARKLDKSLSVEYTVNELIAEATDEKNLALMFSGKLLVVFSYLTFSNLFRLEPLLLIRAPVPVVVLESD